MLATTLDLYYSGLLVDVPHDIRPDLAERSLSQAQALLKAKLGPRLAFAVGDGACFFHAVRRLHCAGTSVAELRRRASATAWWQECAHGSVRVC